LWRVASAGVDAPRRGFVLMCFVGSLLAPSLLEVAHALRRAWSPWLDICTSDPRGPQGPPAAVGGWMPARSTLQRRRS
jgi:hypothetical protein